MSCYVVSHDYINGILTASRYGGNCPRSYYFGGHSRRIRNREHEVGQILLDENIKSFDYRYKEQYKDEYAGMEVFKYRSLPVTFKPAEILGMLDCLEYQSCEHPEWEKSEAYAIIQAIRSEMISEIPGYTWQPESLKQFSNAN